MCRPDCSRHHSLVCLLDWRVTTNPTECFEILSALYQQLLRTTQGGSRATVSVPIVEMYCCCPAIGSNVHHPINVEDNGRLKLASPCSTPAFRWTTCSTNLKQTMGPLPFMRADSETGAHSYSCVASYRSQLLIILYKAGHVRGIELKSPLENARLKEHMTLRWMDGILELIKPGIQLHL